jgi:hypothetical protein
MLVGLTPYLFKLERTNMPKKKTLPKSIKQKAVSLFSSEKDEYAYYLKANKGGNLHSELKKYNREINKRRSQSFKDGIGGTVKNEWN